MIDKETGSIKFPGWERSLGPTVTRAAFVTSSLGAAASIKVKNEPWCSWDLTPVATPPATWYVSAFFHDEALWQVHLQASRPEFGTTWAEITPEKEAQRKALHDSCLASDLGSAPYEFPWGKVESGGMDHYDNPCVVVVTYRE